MARHIARVALPPQATFHVALRKIFGIGEVTALNISEACGISSAMKVRILDDHSPGGTCSLAACLWKQVKDVDQLHFQRVVQHIQEKYVVGDQLKRSIRDNILRLIDIKSYRGVRHVLGLSQHGRTHSNNSTAKKLRHHIMYDTSR